MNQLFGIVHETDDFVVVNKPADLVCHPTKGDVFSSLISRLRLHYDRAGWSGSLHMINRLDRETSGLMLVAKNPEAAGELGRLWEGRSVQKLYETIVHGSVSADEGVVDAPLGRDESSKVAIKDCVRPDGTAAQTKYRVIHRFYRENQHFTHLEIEPLTGRKHQIRIHLAHAGHPIVGEKLYAGNEDDYLALVHDRITEEIRRRLILPCQALHAGTLRFRWRGTDHAYSVQPEEWFRQFLGREPELAAAV